MEGDGCQVVLGLKKTASMSIFSPEVCKYTLFIQLWYTLPGGWRETDSTPPLCYCTISVHPTFSLHTQNVLVLRIYIFFNYSIINLIIYIRVCVKFIVNKWVKIVVQSYR